MKIGCVQFCPVRGQVEHNIKKVDEILSTVNAGSLDLLILPEMALTGYCFPDLESMEPYLEPTSAGVSTEWARRSASRLNAYVAVGYPERRTSMDPERNFNSLVTVSPAGEIVATYSKTFLYYTDETWATEGDKGFFFGSLLPTDGPENGVNGSSAPTELSSVCMGICMDINPYRFTAPWEAREFATHCVDKKAKLVILSMAWMTRLDPSDLQGEKAKSPDMPTLAYWLERLKPLLEEIREEGEEVTIVFANRCGTEPGRVAGIVQGLDEQGEEVVSFAGTSSIMRIKDGGVEILDMLGRAEEALLVADTANAPKYRILHRRPASDSQSADEDEEETAEASD